MDEQFQFNMPISREEVHALVKYHSREASRIARKFGKIAMGDGKRFFPPSGRNLKVMHDVTKVEMEKHYKRAKGLLAALKLDVK